MLCQCHPQKVCLLLPRAVVIRRTVFTMTMAILVLHSLPTCRGFGMPGRRAAANIGRDAAIRLWYTSTRDGTLLHDNNNDDAVEPKFVFDTSSTGTTTTNHPLGSPSTESHCSLEEAPRKWGNEDRIAQWENLTKVYPQDANAFYQFGMALAQHWCWMTESQHQHQQQQQQQQNQPVLASPSPSRCSTATTAMIKGLLQRAIVALESAVQLEREQVWQILWTNTTKRTRRSCSPRSSSSSSRTSANLVVALRTLAWYYHCIGRSNDCLRCIDEQQWWISRKMMFAVEEVNDTISSWHPSFEWIQTKGHHHHHHHETSLVQGIASSSPPKDVPLQMSHPLDDGTPKKSQGPRSRKIAIRTIGDRPLINATTISRIRQSVDEYLQLQQQQTKLSSSSSSSLPYEEGEEIHQAATTTTKAATRFTMQYSGNSDIHLSDLCFMDPSLIPWINEMLGTSIYPLVRVAFGGEQRNEDDGERGEDTILPEEIPPSFSSPLCVYDALIVRYNSTQATHGGRLNGASLPLVREYLEFQTFSWSFSSCSCWLA
jgi:hypothetical protein